MIEAMITGKLIREPVLKQGAKAQYANFLLSVGVGDAEPIVVSGIAFGDVAERIGRMGKGDALAIAGSLKPSSWTDKATGEVKHGLNVTVQSILTAADAKRPARTKADASPNGRNVNQRSNPPPAPPPPADYGAAYGFDDPIHF